MPTVESLSSPLAADLRNGHLDRQDPNAAMSGIYHDERSGLEIAFALLESN